jgi:phage shock protein PspC (stress-responsive transcriptional regulator)
MQKVISINLNANAYQLDESGYNVLREYLAGAERALEGNPDRQEIMADLEQAIADKCRKFLSPHKSVVEASEVEQIVREMGPIDAPSAENDAASASGTTETQQSATAEPRPKCLYRIGDGAMIAGVCMGLATYFAVDVTLVRILFALTAFFTKGFGFFVYILMMFVVPEAKTSEERASAGGAPFNAKEVIDRAKQHYAEGTKQWRRHWRQQQRQWRRQRWAPGVPLAYGQAPLVAPMVPLFALAHFALFMAMAAMIVSLVNTGAILGWALPEGIPVWAGVLMLFVGYQIVVSPIRAVQHWSWQLQSGGQPGPYAFWNAVIWLMGMAFVVWIGSNHLPEIREFIQRLPPLIHDFAEAVRHLFTRVDQ